MNNDQTIIGYEAKTRERSMSPKTKYSKRRIIWLDQYRDKAPDPESVDWWIQKPKDIDILCEEGKDNRSCFVVFAYQAIYEQNKNSILKPALPPFCKGIVPEMVVIAIIIADAYSQQIYVQIDGGEYDVMKIIYDASAHFYKLNEGKFRDLPPEKRPHYEDMILVNSAKFIIEKYSISLKLK